MDGASCGRIVLGSISTLPAGPASITSGGCLILATACRTSGRPKIPPRRFGTDGACADTGEVGAGCTPAFLLKLGGRFCPESFTQSSNLGTLACVRGVDRC